LQNAAPKNAEAYQLYLRGRYFWNKRTDDGVKQGLSYFQQGPTRKRIPGYALAYAGVADSYAVGNGLYLGLTGPEARPKSKAAALKALELDDSLAEAHTTLADTYLYYDWDFAKADKEFRRAIAGEPQLPHRSSMVCGVSLQAWDDMTRPIAEAKRAQELDPLSPDHRRITSGHSSLRPEVRRAIEQYKKSVQMDPNISLAHQDMANAYVQKKMYPEAVAEWQKAMTLTGNPAQATAWAKCIESLGFQAFLQELG